LRPAAHVVRAMIRLGKRTAPELRADDRTT
jgi:hypothetical protein